MTAEAPTTVGEGYEPVGEGLTVFESAEPVFGRAKWLDSPDDVIAFVESGEDVSEVIVIARGGTTTFLSMALNAGVRGIITLQGAPESHLGILSREYGIPCILSVAFQRGMRTARGEVVPADGARLRMDISARPAGYVHMESGAPVDDSPVEQDVPALTAEEQAQIQKLLTDFRGEIPHGAAGDAQMQQSLSSNVLDLSDPEYDRELTAGETTDILRYLAWCVWDALAARAIEGESGLIPRQEYEALGFMDSWFRHPGWLQAIRERVGDAGMVEIGARARSEIGTKINLLHAWAAGTALSEGRAVALELELHEFEYRAATIPAAMTATRQLYQGIWGSGPMFASMCEYRAPVLDRSWIDRFQSDRIGLGSDADRTTFQRFNGALELLGFLVHFDNRLGLGDSGPYPTEDGGFVIVCDRFINEPAYEWSSAAAGLPYAVTIAMFSDGDTDLQTKVQDRSTMFTEPANYLPYVTGVAVYAREQFDTPMSELRTLTLADMDQMRAHGEASSAALYKHIASMSHDGEGDGRCRRVRLRFPVAVRPRGGHVRRTGGRARLHVAGSSRGGQLRDDHRRRGRRDDPPVLPDRHLGQRGAAEQPGHHRRRARRARGAACPRCARAGHHGAARGEHRPADRDRRGGPGRRGGGGLGQAAHRPDRRFPAHAGRAVAVAAAPTGQPADPALEQAYQQFLAPNREFKQLTSQWQADRDLDAVLAGLDRIDGEVSRILGDAAAASARFERYRSRFGEALARFRGGDESALAKPMAASYHDIWMELHEDLLVTLGKERSADDE